MIKYWDNQEQIINQITDEFNKGTYLVILNAPTGSGKTIINLMSGKLSGGSFYTNPLRILVDKIKEELQTKFYEDNLGWGVMGRVAYPCPYMRDKEVKLFNERMEKSPKWMQKDIIEKHEQKMNEYTANGAPCQNLKYKYENADNICPYKKDSLCSYYNDKEKTQKAINAVTTLDYFLNGIYNLNGMSEYWNNRPVLIIDEAHFLPNKLSDFYSVNITSKSLPDFPYDILTTKLNNIKENNPAIYAKKTIDEFLTLLNPYKDEQESYLDSLTDEYDDNEFGYDIVYYGKKMSIDKAIEKQTSLVNQLNFFDTILRLDKVEWVFNNNDKGMYWKPYSPAPFIENLWSSFEHVILSSATFFDIPEYLEQLGLLKKSYKIINVESTFDATKGPIVQLSGGYLNQKNFNTMIDRVVNEVDTILDKYPNVRGIIHCHTYSYQREIIMRSKHRERLIDHSSNTRQDVLKNFIAKEDNSVLVSVNMSEGIDLKDDISRFQIIVKAPYPYRGDPWIQLHYDRSAKWYKQQTIIQIMQMCGRIIRSKEDWGVTYMIDQNISRLLNEFNDIPKWFKDRLKEGDKFRKKLLDKDIDDLLNL